MESPHQGQACSMGGGLRVSILQRNAPSLLPDLCSNSSFCKITDETFPYVSGIFDETMDPSFMSNEPAAATNVPDRIQLKSVTKAQDEVIPENQAKAAYSSWLSMPVETDHTIDFSMSITSAQEDTKEVNSVTDANLKVDTPNVSCHSLESTSSTEKTKNQSNNSTFDMAKSLKERFSGLNLTKPVPNKVTGSSNVTFEKSVDLQEKSSGLSCTISNDDASVEEQRLGEKPLNSTVDVCGLSKSSTEQTANQKLNGTIDITQSNRSKHEQSNEDRTCSVDGKKQSTTEEANVTVDLETAGVSLEVAQPGSLNMEPVDGTFTKHNTTTDLAPSEPVPDSTKNTTMTMVKSCNMELSVQPNSNSSATVKDTSTSGPSAPVNTTAPVRCEVIICSDGSLDLPETDCKEEPQDIFRTKTGTSDNEGYLNLDISQSSVFSLEEMLEFKPCPLVASTPIVLGRGFDRLATTRPTNIQKQLSVINSINSQTNENLHEGSDTSKTNQLSVKSGSCGQIQKVFTNGSSNSTTSEAAIGNKPLSKLAVRRKIPQPSCKSNIPKTQLPLRPSTLQVTSAVVKSKTAAGSQALNQPETSSSSALQSMRRTIHLNKGKTLAPAKNISTASAVKSLSAAVTTTTCHVTAVKKAGAVCMTLPKPSGLQPPGRGRFGVKPPGSAVSSEETGHPQTNNKQNGLSAMSMRNSLLPGFTQKHASSDVLPLAKRKKTDLQNHPSCAPSGSGTAGVQRNVAASTEITSNSQSNDCGNCTLLQEKLRTFHEELGGFLQEPGLLSADCKKWVSLQQKLESCLEDVRRLQTDHH